MDCWRACQIQNSILNTIPSAVFWLQQLQSQECFRVSLKPVHVKTDKLVS